MDTVATPLDGAEACLFDLDGVLTPTSAIHRWAWGELFAQVFALYPKVRKFTDEDYYNLVDGRPRYDAVQAVLNSRGIPLPLGDTSSQSESPSMCTVCGIGDLKDALFLGRLKQNPVAPYPGSMRFLQAIAKTGIGLGVVSASKNARQVLESAGIVGEFDVIVDGLVAEEMGLAGKPDPAPYLEAANRLGAAPRSTIVIEDALNGVASGQAGGFGWVIGVDRGVGTEALLTHGATLVVTDLKELVEERK